MKPFIMKRNGFGILEVLIVLIIVGLLAGIAALSFSQNSNMESMGAANDIKLTINMARSIAITENIRTTVEINETTGVVTAYRGTSSRTAADMIATTNIARDHKSYIADTVTDCSQLGTAAQSGSGNQSSVIGSATIHEIVFTANGTVWEFDNNRGSMPVIISVNARRDKHISSMPWKRSLLLQRSGIVKVYKSDELDKGSTNIPGAAAC